MSLSATLVERVKERVPPAALPAAMEAGFLIRSLPYLGTAVHCPCCGGSFSRFLSAGRRGRASRCPRCRSVERHRLLWLYMQQRTNLFRDRLRMLQFAPEFALSRRLAKLPNLEYITADLFSPQAMLKLDITDIPFKDNSMDVILTTHVLEHIPDDATAMRELARVLRPSGWAILQSPMWPDRAATYEDPSIATPEGREQAFGQWDHVRIYGRDYQDRLEAAGFKVTADPFVKTLSPEARHRYGIEIDDDVWFCTKA